MNEYESNLENFDSSYAYAGYAPISVRLAQLAAKSLPNSTTTTTTSNLTWEGSLDVLKLIPGETFEKSIIPENRSFKSDRHPNAPQMTLVVFVGGCTLAEVSALRTLSMNEKCKFNCLR